MCKDSVHFFVPVLTELGPTPNSVTREPNSVAEGAMDAAAAEGVGATRKGTERPR